jgi:hypothetical protein
VGAWGRGKIGYASVNVYGDYKKKLISNRPTEFTGWTGASFVTLLL